MITSKDLYNILPMGKRNAVYVDELAYRLNMDDGKTQLPVRQLIRKAIGEGFLIGACGKGYFKISSRKELEDYVKNLRLRAYSILQRASILLENWDAQSIHHK